jgi:tRNA(adenine34) deaminase
MDSEALNRTLELAWESVRQGNMPVGAVVVLDGKIISEGKNSCLSPELNPAAHAEIAALNKIDRKLLFARAKDMTIYATLEPCVMCFGTIILYRIGRLVYGASDQPRGACYLYEKLKEKYGKKRLPVIEGPCFSQEVQTQYQKEYAEAYKNYRNIRDAKERHEKPAE